MNRVFVGMLSSLLACTTHMSASTDRAQTSTPPTFETGSPPLPTADSGSEVVRSWSEGPALLAPLQEHSVVALLGEVVVLGGYDDARRMVDRVEAYDPSAEQWRSLASLPAPAHHVNAAVVGDRIYVLGVLQGGFLESAVLWIYDPVLDAWSEGARPPASHAVGASVVAVQGTDIHLVGGLQSVRAVALHSVYDTVADAWSPLPDSPRPRDHAAGGGTGSILIAVGGREATIASVVDSVDRYTPTSNAWEAGAALPTARAGVAHAFDADGHLHVLGGEGNPDDPDGVFDAHEAYDPVGDQWEVLGPMPRPRHGMGAVFIDGVLYVPGGAPVAGFGAVDAFDHFGP